MKDIFVRLKCFPVEQWAEGRASPWQRGATLATWLLPISTLQLLNIHPYSHHKQETERKGLNAWLRRAKRWRGLNPRSGRGGGGKQPVAMVTSPAFRRAASCWEGRQEGFFPSLSPRTLADFSWKDTSLFFFPPEEKVTRLIFTDEFGIITWKCQQSWMRGGTRR